MNPTDDTSTTEQQPGHDFQDRRYVLFPGEHEETDESISPMVDPNWLLILGTEPEGETRP